MLLRCAVEAEDAGVGHSVTVGHSDVLVRMPVLGHHIPPPREPGGRDRIAHILVVVGDPDPLTSVSAKETVELADVGVGHNDGLRSVPGTPGRGCISKGLEKSLAGLGDTNDVDVERGEDGDQTIANEALGQILHLLGGEGHGDACGHWATRNVEGY